MKKQRGVVISSRTSDYPDPLVLRVGERVAVGQKKSDWLGWLWITDQRGKSGWIPETYISWPGSTGTVLRDYDATELDVKKGEKLIIHEEAAGWYWCTNAAGQKGWVPVENVASLLGPE